MIHGDMTAATEPFSFREGSLIVSDPVELDDPSYLFRVAVRADAVGASGDVDLRGVVYTQAGVLVSYGPVDVLEDEAPEGLVWLAFDRAAGRVLPQGSYRAGVQFGDGGGSLLTDVDSPVLRPTVKVGGSAPADGPYLHWDLSDPDVPELTIRDDGAGTAPSAAAFVQPAAPAHGGPLMWVDVGRMGDWTPGDPVEITFDDDGAGDATQDTDLVLAIGGSIRNLESNPSFGVDADRWGPNNSSGWTGLVDGRAPVPGEVDVWGWRCHATNPTATLRQIGCLTASVPADGIPVSPGDVITVTATTYSIDPPTTHGLRIQPIFLNAAGAPVLATSYGSWPLTPGRQDWAQTITVPVGATEMLRQATGVFTSAAETIDVYLTNLGVITGAGREFFNGDTAGHRWDAVEHASTSSGPYGQPRHALHWLEMHAEDDAMVMSAGYAPQLAPTSAPPPARLDDVNHLVSGPMLLETIDLFEIPGNVSDDYLAAHLPWDLSQRALGATGPIRGSRVLAAATWSGPAFAQTRGAQAIVRSGSPLADFVGDRIRIRTTFAGRTATVYAYVTDERDDIPDGVTADLLLTYRAFIALANPAEDFINVSVDRLG